MLASCGKPFLWWFHISHVTVTKLDVSYCDLCEVRGKSLTWHLHCETIQFKDVCHETINVGLRTMNSLPHKLSWLLKWAVFSLSVYRKGVEPANSCLFSLPHVSHRVFGLSYVFVASLTRPLLGHGHSVFEQSLIFCVIYWTFRGRFISADIRRCCLVNFCLKPKLYVVKNLSQGWILLLLMYTFKHCIIISLISDISYNTQNYHVMIYAQETL